MCRLTKIGEVMSMNFSLTQIHTLILLLRRETTTKDEVINNITKTLKPFEPTKLCTQLGLPWSFSNMLPINFCGHI